MPRIIPTKETIFLLKTIALVDDLPDWGGDFVFESKNFLDAGLVFASDIELSEILGVFRILSLVFVVNLSNEIISEYSLERHFLLAKRTVFVENSKEDAEGEESIEKTGWFEISHNSLGIFHYQDTGYGSQFLIKKLECKFRFRIWLYR
ncbi:2837_t:CDS:2 [Entrophospora sp. SA101]|nr:13024_t:CDS:2 [Entrophospora sp. SA101]CAJ0847627.1 2837_t:CDS:2 [Entrophospora sp. SA101]